MISKSAKPTNPPAIILLNNLSFNVKKPAKIAIKKEI